VARPLSVLPLPAVSGRDTMAVLPPMSLGACEAGRLSPGIRSGALGGHDPILGFVPPFPGRPGAQKDRGPVRVASAGLYGRVTQKLPGLFPVEVVEVAFQATARKVCLSEETAEKLELPLSRPDFSDEKTRTEIVKERMKVTAYRRFNDADGDAPLLVGHPGLSGLGAHRSQGGGPGGGADHVRTRRVARLARGSDVLPAIGGSPVS
jgi:hypothetical protein